MPEDRELLPKDVLEYLESGDRTDEQLDLMPIAQAPSAISSLQTLRDGINAQMNARQLAQGSFFQQSLSQQGGMLDGRNFIAAASVRGLI